MSGILFVYTTCSSIEEAEELAEKCVKKRLAACGNILPQMRSVYQWKGKLEKEDEIVLILKTKKKSFQDLKLYMEKEHPYEIPCILSWDISDGNASYMNWLNNQVIN